MKNYFKITSFVKMSTLNTYADKKLIKVYLHGI